MTARVKYVNVVTDKKTGRKYYYCRLTGTRLPSPDDHLAFIAAVAAARAHLGPDPMPSTVLKATQVAAKAKTPDEPLAEDRSFRKLVEKYRASEDYLTLGERTRQEYDRHITRLLEPLAKSSVAGITRPHVKTIMSKFPGTVGRAVKRMLSVLLSFAIEDDWIKTNPAFGLEKKRRKRRTADQHGDRVERGQRPLEEAEIAKVRTHNPEGTRRRAIFEVMLGAALRRGDSRRIPSDLAQRDTIPLITNKTGQLVVAPVTDHMRRAAQAWSRARIDAKLPLSNYLICNQRGQPLHERTVSAEITALFVAAGMPKRGAHALRYTAAVRLLELGFAYEDVAEHLGHSDAKMARLYCEKRREAEFRGRILNSADAASEGPIVVPAMRSRQTLQKESS